MERDDNGNLRGVDAYLAGDLGAQELSGGEMKKRFRLLDWKTRWFCVYVFYRREYGEPMWDVSVFRPSAADLERGVFIERPNRWGWGWEVDPPVSEGSVEASLETWSDDGERLTCSLGHGL